jgi:hypothetical protein
MPVYTFRIRSSGGKPTGEEILTLADEGAAREHARVIGDNITAASNGRRITWSIVVTDEQSKAVFQILREVK